MTFPVSIFIFLHTATSNSCSMYVVFGDRLRRMTSFFMADLGKGRLRWEDAPSCIRSNGRSLTA